jgi:hypothetical protein
MLQEGRVNTSKKAKKQLLRLLEERKRLHQLKARHYEKKIRELRKVV